MSLFSQARESYLLLGSRFLAEPREMGWARGSLLVDGPHFLLQSSSGQYSIPVPTELNLFGNGLFAQAAVLTEDGLVLVNALEAEVARD